MRYYNRTADRLFLALFIAVALALIFPACAAEDDPGAPDTYLDDIRIEATRTSQLNSRTDALLTANESLSATATAAYAELGEDATGLKALSDRLDVLSGDLEFLLGNPVVDGDDVIALQLQIDRMRSELTATINRTEQQRIQRNADMDVRIGQLNALVDEVQGLAFDMGERLIPTDNSTLCTGPLSVEALTAVSGIGLVLANRIRIAAGC